MSQALGWVLLRLLPGQTSQACLDGVSNDAKAVPAPVPTQTKRKPSRRWLQAHRSWLPRWPGVPVVPPRWPRHSHLPGTAVSRGLRWQRAACSHLLRHRGACVPPSLAPSSVRLNPINRGVQEPKTLRSETKAVYSTPNGHSEQCQADSVTVSRQPLWL